MSAKVVSHRQRSGIAYWARPAWGDLRRTPAGRGPFLWIEVTADYTQTLAFLETLYANTDGYIETRCIVDRATGEPRQPGDM